MYDVNMEAFCGIWYRMVLIPLSTFGKLWRAVPRLITRKIAQLRWHKAASMEV